ncbi:MAG: ornithine cyclodeaminase family protein, partial [Gammaproteobacteria bacterium]|nr:ornithine cyclodeaminase family protein [Gammaproteobacteria bacterium]
RMRVGAANGIALKHLAREDVTTLALIGSGWQAGAQLMAAMAVRNFRKVRVYSTRQENRERFVEEVNPLYPSTDIEVADTAQDCVADADVIMSATSAMIPVLQPEWIKPGMHVSCIKTYEVSPEVMDKCDVVFIHTQAQGKHLDNIMPGTPNLFSESKHKEWVNDRENGILQYPDIKKLVAGQEPGRDNPGQVTCFVNNIGMGLQFAAAGAVIYKKAMEAGVGVQLEDDWFSEDVHP